MPAAITDAVASVICTPTSPSRDQYTSSSSSSSADSSNVRPTPMPSGIASVSRAFGSLANSAALPDANASRIPGTKWWMWRRPIRTSNRSGTPLRTPRVVRRTTLDEITKDISRLNIADSPAGASR